jgi:signal transduction histidine kinase
LQISAGVPCDPAAAPPTMHRSLLADALGTAASLATPARRRTAARQASGVSPRRWLSPQRLLIACLVAVVAAAALVVYLERRAAALQRIRTDMVVRQVCERTAAALATRTRELFGAGVLGTIEAIGHREIEQYHLARVDEVLAAGVRQHRYIDRFFFWHDRMPDRYDGQVLFYRPAAERGRHDIATGPGRGGFFAEPGRGTALRQVGERLGARAQSFAVEHVTLDGVAYQAVFHFMWANPQRTAAFSVIGYLVDLDGLRAGRFAEIAAVDLEPLLNPGAELPRLQLRVEDGDGRRITGARNSDSELPSASERFDLLFFPARELSNYLAPLPAVASWRLVVRPEAPLPDGSPSGLWLLGAVVGLLVIAVVCAVGVNREAIRLAQLQSDFVLNVSHQLRTPLAMLSGAAETLGLERLRSPEKIKHYADIVQAQTGRLSAMVDQILQVHTADHVAAAVTWQRVDLGALVARAAADVQLLADRRDVAVSVAQPADVVLVDGDPAALEHVVLNLLENAVKYGPEAGNTVRVEVRRAGRRAVVTVADRGAGIARADLPHIFEKFYRGRVDGPTRRGFGLGLAIVRTTIDAHGGSIAVSSERGRGSVFTVSLPLARQQ